MENLVKKTKKIALILLVSTVISVSLQVMFGNLRISAGTGNSATVDVINFKPEKTKVEIERNINKDNHIKEINFNKVGDLPVYGFIKMDTTISESTNVIDIRALIDSIGSNVAISLSKDELAMFHPVKDDIVVLDGEKIMRMEIRVNMEAYHSIKEYNFDLDLMEEQGLVPDDYVLDIDFRTITADNKADLPSAWFNVLSVESQTD